MLMKGVIFIMVDGLSKKEKAYFMAAKAVSTLSNHKQKLGCVIVDGHKIISSGHNSQTKCHSIQATIDKKFFQMDNCKGPIHAELDALLPLMRRKYNLSGATVYVYRQNKSGSPAMAHPCPRCMEIIKACGIKKLKYTTADGYAMEKLIY